MAAVHKPYHATAISWDKHAMLHCTWVFWPAADGTDEALMGSGWTRKNHVYCIFTAAMEKMWLVADLMRL